MIKRKPLSEETKRKIGIANSIALKGKKLSDEHKKNISLNHSKHTLGKRMSDEQKLKISKTKKGVKRNPEDVKRTVAGNTGKKRSVEQKLRMYLAQKNGSESHSWKGGMTPLIDLIRKIFKYRQWRSDVFTRDDYTCQKCNIKGGKLSAHHIKSFFEIIRSNNIKSLEESIECEELWNINNGLTLCQECHKLTDNYGGKNIKNI